MKCVAHALQRFQAIMLRFKASMRLHLLGIWCIDVVQCVVCDPWLIKSAIVSSTIMNTGQCNTQCGLQTAYTAHTVYITCRLSCILTHYFCYTRHFMFTVIFCSIDSARNQYKNVLYHKGNQSWMCCNDVAEAR